MKSTRKSALTLLSVLILTAMLASNLLASAAIMFVETQFTYGQPDTAWLKDLIIKEDVLTVQGLSERVKLIAQPDYPYSETPESFAQVVGYYLKFYELDPGSQEAAYLYIMEQLNKFSAATELNVSDEYIKFWLQSSGIKYPENGLKDNTTLILARTLYAAMSRSNLGVSSFPKGTSLESAAIQIIAKVFGMDISLLSQWLDDVSVDNLESYIIATSKIALYTMGYDVSKSTPKEEVYRLMAVMTIEKQGISIDAKNASFEEIKIKYLAAMLGRQFGVALDPAELQKAIANDRVPLYILQVMGKTANLTIRSDSNYADAFIAVAQNTHFFDLDENEFYCDIYNYKGQLKYKRSSVWINPAALYKDGQGTKVVITANGAPIKDNYYSEVPIDPNQKEQVIQIKVTYTKDGQTNSKTYNITIINGTQLPPTSGSGKGDNQTIDDIIENLIPKTEDVTEALDSLLGNLPGRIKDISSLLVPDFSFSDISFDSISGFFSDFFNAGSQVLKGSVLGGIGGLDLLRAEKLPGFGALKDSKLFSTVSQEAANLLELSFLPDSEDSKSGSPVLHNAPDIVDVGYYEYKEPEEITQPAVAVNVVPYQPVESLASPPKGYEYVTDANGYAVGLAVSNGGRIVFENDGSASFIKKNMVYILLPITAAAAVVVTVLAKKKQKVEIIPEEILNFEE
ncbi:MAG TPA: hypothetical protein PLY67_04320 [Clostridiales bacterium]|nr:hypothetical protein [Clostridiales bacterium]